MLAPIAGLAEESSVILIAESAVQSLVTDTYTNIVHTVLQIQGDLLHLKQDLCHLYPPAIFSSAANTVLSHTGQLLGISLYLITMAVLGGSL